MNAIHKNTTDTERWNGELSGCSSAAVDDGE
jgi:hypothetical protein